MKKKILFITNKHTKKKKKTINPIYQEPYCVTIHDFTRKAKLSHLIDKELLRFTFEKKQYSIDYIVIYMFIAVTLS